MVLITVNLSQVMSLKVLDEIEEKPDYIILDPPRDGIHPKAIGKTHRVWC